MQGSGRVLGELTKFVVTVSRLTVVNILKEPELDPSPERAKVTVAPTGEWVTQQARNFTMAAADMKLGVTHLIIDHDAKFTAAFDAVLEADGIEVKRVGPRAPNMNAHAERFVQILRHELLDYFVTMARSI